MQPEIRNEEAQFFNSVERYKKNIQALARIKEQKDSLASSGRRDSSLFDILHHHVAVAKGLAGEICQLLPSASAVSSEEKIIWSGNLSDLQFDFLNGNKFKITGPNAIVSENNYDDRSSDTVAVVVSKSAESEGSAEYSIASLAGMEVKIFRLE